MFEPAADVSTQGRGPRGKGLRGQDPPARQLEAEAARRTRELVAHVGLVLAALNYARAVADLAEGQLAQLEAVRGSLAEWRRTGERLRELSDAQLHDLAVYVSSLQLADHAPLREAAELVLRARHPGLAAASTLVAVLSRHAG